MFFQKLAAATTAERNYLLATPQIVDGLRGCITLPTYIAYLTEAYHHVKHTVPLLRATKERLAPGQKWLEPAIEEYITEESGHELWILDDIRAAGGNVDAVRAGVPRPATEFMIAFAYDYINRINPAGFFGMVFVLEGTSVQLATSAADAIKTSLKLGDECFHYLTSHGCLDLEHMRFFEHLMNRVNDAGDQDAIIQMAQRMFVLFANVFSAFRMELRTKQPWLMPLKGKIVVLTGGSGGIGRQLANLLREECADIVTIGRSPSTVEGSLSIVADLGTEDGLASASEAIAKVVPDIIVHLAGVQFFGRFVDQTEKQLLASYRINLMAPALLTKAAMPGMLLRGSGHVLFAGSVFGGIPFAHFAGYSSAKAGLAALCTALEREYADNGIVFTCAVPRAVDTAMATPNIRQFAAMAGFRFDDPAMIARRLLAVLKAGGGTVGPGFPESLFLRLSAIAPSLVSRGLAAGDRKARKQLLASTHIQPE